MPAWRLAERPTSSCSPATRSWATAGSTRMRDAARSDSTVGTASTLGNNAGLLSVPAPVRAAPGGREPGAARRATSPRGRRARCPARRSPTRTACGSRARRSSSSGRSTPPSRRRARPLIDFSQRCLRHGFVNVVADDVFVASALPGLSATAARSTSARTARCSSGATRTCGGRSRKALRRRSRVPCRSPAQSRDGHVGDGRRAHRARRAVGRAGRDPRADRGAGIARRPCGCACCSIPASGPRRSRELERVAPGRRAALTPVTLRRRHSRAATSSTAPTRSPAARTSSCCRAWASA